MIWTAGRIVPDDGLRISALDRTFEHGLGLFETLRTYDRKPTLLDRHLARMKRSAAELKLPVDAIQWPDRDAVADLLDAEKADDDVRLRITLSGGTSKLGGGTLWMRMSPLPPPLRHEGAVVDLGLWWPDRPDSLDRHKSLNYWARRRAYDRACDLGYDEVLRIGGSKNQTVYEGSCTNVFMVSGGLISTPSIENPIVPGIMRELVIELAKEIGVEVNKARHLPLSALLRGDEVFLTNSVRGIMPVSRLSGPWRGKAAWDWTVPGEWTQRLSILVNDWLGAGGNPQ